MCDSCISGFWSPTCGERSRTKDSTGVLKSDPDGFAGRPSNPREQCQNGNAGVSLATWSLPRGLQVINHSPLATEFPWPPKRKNICARRRLPGTHTQTGIAVTPTKQRTEAISTRYKCRPGEGSASRGKIVTEGTLFCFLPRVGASSWLPPGPKPTLLIATHGETGFPVTPTKQTTAVLSNRNKKTPPGGWHLSYPRRRLGEHVCTNSLSQPCSQVREWLHGRLLALHDGELMRWSRWARTTRQACS